MEEVVGRATSVPDRTAAGRHCRARRLAGSPRTARPQWPLLQEPTARDSNRTSTRACTTTTRPRVLHLAPRATCRRRHAGEPPERALCYASHEIDVRMTRARDRERERKRNGESGSAGENRVELICGLNRAS